MKKYWVYQNKTILLARTVFIVMLSILFNGCQNQTSNKLAIKTVAGDITYVHQTALEKLKDELMGEVIDPANDKYESTRSIWNRARFDQRPAYIIQAVNESDVMATINFARKNNLMLSVKGGGHNSTAYAMNDGGLVLDLAKMKHIEIDTVAKTVKAGPGLLWKHLDAATQKHGLAVTGAIVSDVGIGGFTLGGGLGWLHRSLGSASDNLIAAEIVTYDGQLLKLGPDENEELFWAIRGGGGNFGVVTSFTYQLHSVGPVLLAGLVFYPFDEIETIISAYNNYIKDIPDELGTWLLFRKAPPSPALPKEIHGKPIVAIAITYNGSLAEGKKWSAPLRNIVTPIKDLVQPRNYVDWQKSLDGAWGYGYHNLWQGHFLDEIGDDFITNIKKYVPEGSLYSDIKIQHLEGAFGRMPKDSTAFGHRDKKFGLVIQTRWQDARETSAQEAWAKSVFESLAPTEKSGVYVNFVDREGIERVKDAYESDSYERLQRIKAKYDAINFFRKNQNIQPK